MAHKQTSIDERFDYIRRFLADGCEPPWQAYIEALFPAFIRMLASLFWIDLFQTFRSFLGAVFFGGGGGGHSRGRGAKRRGKPKTFLKRARKWLNWDPYDHAGRAAGEWLDLGWFAETRTSIALWTLTTTVERLLFIFFVADIVTEFWYDYTMYLAETEACRSARHGWLYAKGDDQIASGILTTWPTVCPDVQKSRGPVWWNVSSGGYTGQGGGFFHSAGVEALVGQDPPQNVQIVIRDTDTGEERTADWSGKAGGVVGVGFNLEPGHRYSIGSRGVGLWKIVNPSVSIVGYDEQPV